MQAHASPVKWRGPGQEGPGAAHLPPEVSGWNFPRWSFDTVMTNSHAGGCVTHPPKGRSSWRQVPGSESGTSWERLALLCCSPARWAWRTPRRCLRQRRPWRNRRTRHRTIPARVTTTTATTTASGIRRAAPRHDMRQPPPTSRFHQTWCCRRPVASRRHEARRSRLDRKPEKRT